MSVVGLGTWQLGADWGAVDPDDARATLDAAVEAGVTFFDTADAYGDGRSEQFCNELRSRHPDSRLLVATKMGRRVEQLPENYNRENFLAWNDRSRQNLGVETIDLVQLHCPPSEVYEDDAAFEVLDEMVAAGRMAAYGVSVETCAQALAAIARPHVATVQIILNCFRLKPLEEVLPAAAKRGSGSSRGSRWPPDCSQDATTRTRSSARTTTATSTATGRPSTSARPSPACRSRSAWPPCARSQPWFRRARRCRSSRFAG